MAWLTGWDYRKPLVITGGASGAQTDFQLDIAIAHAAAKMQADFDDIRFTKTNGTDLIDAWLESKVDSTSADVWVEFPTTPANTVESTYYMYYGKSDAASDWDIGETFIFGDDFEGGIAGNLPSGWTVNENVGTVRISDTTANSGTKSVKINDTGSQTAGLYGYVQLPNDMDDAILEFAAKVPSPSYLAIGLDDSSFDTSITGYVPCNWLCYGSNWGYRSNNGFVSVEPTDTSWNKYSITVDKTNYIDISENNVNKVTDQSLNNVPDLYRYLKMFMIGGGASSYGYFDDIRVRKYAANPPTYAFGSEESAPTGGASRPLVNGGLARIGLINGGLIS